MASLSFLLGMIPATDKVESADDQLRADYQAFLEYESSDELKRFQELEKELRSSDFAIRKKKIKKADYPQSEEYQKETEYDVLRKSEKMQWFVKTRKKNPFKELSKWVQTFDEPFDKPALDESKWMTRYFWGEKGLDDSFTLGDDLSFPTNGDNVEFYDNKARLVTKAGEATGLAWRDEQGFVREDFDFTSALISTAKSFHQKYGIFKAKIKMAPDDVTQGFWMVSEQMLPHIDVARYDKGKIWANYFWGGKGTTSKSLSKTNGSKYADEYYIYTLEWTPNKLTWKINDKVFKTQTSGVPQEEMYISFSTHLKKDADSSGLPSAMELDWVRAYKLKD